MASSGNESGNQKKTSSGCVMWIIRIFRGLLILILVLSILGFNYQTIATQINEKKYPAPVQLIDIGGHHLHLYCTGESQDGSPTVILEQGLGGTSPAWAWVQPEVAKQTRVCSYDRAGLGWSDPPPKGTARDGKEVAAELHTLLQKANITPPY